MSQKIQIKMKKNGFSQKIQITPVLRIDNQQNFKIMKILILLKSFFLFFFILYNHVYIAKHL